MIIEMHGTVAQWNGTNGHILTDDGERIPISRLTFIAHGSREMPKVGDRITCSASKHIEVYYELEEIHAFVPAPPNKTKLRQLYNLNRALRLQRSPREREMIGQLYLEDLIGTVESYNPKKGFGFILAETGERVFIHATCLRAAGYQSVEAGSTLSFSAIERPKGWQAFQVHWLEQPEPH